MKTSAVSPLETPKEISLLQKPEYPIAHPHTAFSLLAPYVILVLFTLVLLWPLCIGRSLYWGDILLYFEPMQRYAHVSLQHGRIPLWNPYVFGGQPYVGNPQIGVFYPLNLLTPLLPAWLYLNISLMLHLFLCGAFMYRFLIRWTATRSAALAGALVYMGGSALVGRLQFPPMIQTVAYCPLLLHGLDAWIARSSLNAWLLTALSVGLIALAAHPQMAYLIYMCALLYGGLRIWNQTAYTEQQEATGPFHSRFQYLGKHTVCFVRTALPLAAAAGAGVLLSAVQMLPILQLLLESPRSQMTAEMANRFYLALPDLLTLLFPNFYGHPASSNYWTAGNAWEPAVFVGWAPLLCIGVAVVQRKHEPFVRFWSIAAILTIWLATGTAGGLFRLAFLLLPGLSKFHDPARFLFLTSVAFAALTASGFDALRISFLKRRPQFYRTTFDRLALASIVMPLLWFGWRWNPTTDLYRKESGGLSADRDQSTSLSAAIPQHTRIFNSSHENYWRRYITHGYADYGEQNDRTVQVFLETELPNLPMRSGVESTSGYEPVQVMGASTLDNLNRVAEMHKEPNFSRLIGIWNARTAILPHEQRLRDPRLIELETDVQANHVPTVTLWQNKDAMPRCWMVRNTLHVESSARLLAALTSPEFDPTQVAIISGIRTKDLDQDDLEWGTARTKRESAQSVIIVTQSADTIRLAADAGDHSAFLVYSGTAYPGWKAIVDGRSVPLYRANGSLMGLTLPSGKHEILLHYAPNIFSLGLYLTHLAMAGLSGAMVCLLLHRQKGIRSIQIRRIMQDLSSMQSN